MRDIQQQYYCNAKITAKVQGKQSVFMASIARNGEEAQVLQEGLLKPVQTFDEATTTAMGIRSSIKSL
jgi:hypothetical protein